MIPVLYESTETNFSTYGIGALSDITSCVVTEERNGQYECLFAYPITGAHYSDIQAERIIKAKAHPIGDDQLFRIYRISKPLRGIVTVYAQHISYDLSGASVAPFTGSYTPAAALDHVLTGTGFTGHTNKSGAKTFSAEIPKSARSLLGGTEGSILDLWGGEYKFDNYDVYLYVERGLDRQVVIEYGKNLTELVADHNLTDVYSELLPYATYMDDSGSHTVTGDTIPITSVLSRSKTLIKDFTFEFEGEVTKAQLNAAAAAWLANNPLGYETPSLTVSFTPESVIPARIDLCDTVTIRYTALGVDVKAKVVKTEYDSLLERYTRLTVGKPRANMADTVAALTDQARVTADYPSLWKSAIATATEMITGNTGGNVVLHTGPDGKPYELLVMDNTDITIAQKIWRWTLGGLGYSTNGYDGPYELAITADGRINLDFLRTGRLVISDASDNVLFDADINTNRVYIAGFTVENDKFSYTKETASSTVAGKNDTETVEIANGHISTSTTKWDDLGSGTFTYEETSDMSQGELHLTVDTTNDPDGGKRTSANIIGGMVSLEYEKGNVRRQVLIDPEAPHSIQVISETMDSGGNYSGNTVWIGDEDIKLHTDSPDRALTISADGPTPTSGYAQVSVPTGTAYKTVTNFDLEPGTYLIQVHFAFNTNGNNKRVGIVSYSEDSAAQISAAFRADSVAVPGINTYLNICGIVKPNTTTTFYLNAMQDSGSALNTFVSWSYVRLA